MPDVLPAGPTLFDAFVRRVKAQPDATAFIFVDDAGEQETPVSNRELDERARRIAAVLLQAGAQGQPVMLLYTPGLDYISALLGCLYAGCIAVPAYPPLHQRQASRVQSLIDDARAPVVLTNASWFDAALLPPPGEHPCTWIHTGRAPHADLPPWTGQPSWRPEATVVLQYTSGSTGQPKGVMLSAGNLTHNVQHMAQRLACRPDMRGVTWLPPYHDMGLIAGILLPLYVGFVGVTMTPASFAQRPVRWLQAVSRHRAEITGGPNAAYELCVDKVSDEQLATLDLRSWRVAVNGAEPVRASTLHRFSARFAACGLASRTFHPCYGLAEATLFVTGGPWDAEVDAGFDPADDAQQAVPLGRSLPDQALRIVDADTCQPCGDGVEGEVWVRGPSVASGYWRQPELSEATFRARLKGEDAGDAQANWLRTGDLGLMTHGTLRVTGRIKDQINLAGRKLYPHDIEQAAQRSHAALRKHSGAAFAVPGQLRDQLVLVQELEPRAKADPDVVLAAIRQALGRELGVQADDICLVKAGVVDKTSSGKVRRSSCRQAYIGGHIEAVARSQRPDDTARAGRCAASGAGAERDAMPVLVPQHPVDMLSLLRQHLARQLAVGVDQIDTEVTLAELGVDSLALTQLQAQLDVLGAPALPLQQLFGSPLSRLAVALLPPAQADQAHGQPHSATLITDPASAHAPFPLTPLQQAYVLGRGEVSAHVYSQHEVGQLDVHRLRHAWQALCLRHPMLRLRMAGWPMQRILPAHDPQATPAWQHHAWSDLQPDVAQACLDALARQLSHQVLPLDGPLCEVHLCHLPEGRVRLLVSIDMLLADATSLYTLLADWGRLYAQAEWPCPMPALSLSFRDLVLHKAALGQLHTAREAAHAAREAWQARLSELPGAPDLPLLSPTSEAPQPALERLALAGLAPARQAPGRDAGHAAAARLRRSAGAVCTRAALHPDAHAVQPAGRARRCGPGRGRFHLRAAPDL
jgi:acyl-CoA synthetase (AMP-forming)/AMP-acid ligase II